MVLTEMLHSLNVNQSLLQHDIAMQDTKQCIIADTDSGDALWSGKVQHLESMAWHPNEQSFFLSTITNPDTPLQKIHTHQVTLADGVMRRCPLGPGNDKVAELDDYEEDFVDMTCGVSVSQDGYWLCRQRPQTDDGHEGDQINEFLHLEDACIATLDGAQMDGMPWGKNSSKVVCHFNDGRVCIYQPNKASIIGTYIPQPGVSVNFNAGLCWSPDDRYVALAVRHDDRDCTSFAMVRVHSVWILEASQDMPVVARIVLPTRPEVDAVFSLEWSSNYACLAVQLYASGSLVQHLLISFLH